MIKHNKYYKYVLKLSILLIAVISFGCGQKKYDSGKDLVTKNGLIYKIGEKKPFTGKVKGKANNKAIEYEVRNGLKDGEFVLYFPNGNIEIKGKIVEGENEGQWNYYYPNRSLESQGNFKDDLVNGKWLWYFPNGNLKEEGKYVAGEREGEWFSYNDDGSLYIKRYFKDNVLTDSVLAK